MAQLFSLGIVEIFYAHVTRHCFSGFDGICCWLLKRLTASSNSDDYGVTVNVQGRWITVGPSDLLTTNKIIQICDVLADVLGKNFTNYTINFVNYNRK